MTPEELSRIREIYEQALSLEGLQRGAFLDRECEGKEDVREAVERLLKAREQVPAWLEQPVAGVARPFVAVELPKMEGRQLSGYTLVREIGHGGMGVVFLGERSDGAFRKQVAIKVVQPSSDSPGVIARFRQERQILASLDHPNIAKLLDGGVTEEGWPYFVMELVEGQPIHRWCDERKLNTGQRIELFRSVIEAVRYAHQRLVVHRDLKPGNILVTNEGVVKLLDFGIAKVLSTNDAGAAETVTLAQMMTPEYASPEQVNGSPITTLSDVYSLGVVLYELLTGHRPYRLLSAAMHEMARVIAEVEPTRPSDVVTTTESGSEGRREAITPESVSAVRDGDPNRLRKRLAGDLDSILLMALRKEPEQRYGSVESLSDDLRSHLEHRPVTARQATPWERIRRFCRRNPGAVVAGALLVLALLVSGIAVIWQARRNIAEAQLAKGGDLFLGPLLLYFSGIILVVLCVVIYFVRPNRARLLGAAIGGVFFAIVIACKWWLESYLGWWHSRFAERPDPFFIFSPITWFAYPMAGMALLLVLSVLGRRFGWKAQGLFLLVLGFYQETREQFWFSRILPVVTYEPGVIPILGGATMLICGGLMGLLIMRLIAGRDEASR